MSWVESVLDSMAKRGLRVVEEERASSRMGSRGCASDAGRRRSEAGWSWVFGGGRAPWCPVGVAATLALGGCAPAFPSFATPVRAAPEQGQSLDPTPPDDLLYLRLRGATVPERTRDGRHWDAFGQHAPDPFAVVYLDGEELFRTRPERNTYRPTWPGSPEGNFRIPPRSTLRVEMFDQNPMKHRPICLFEFSGVDDDVFAGGREAKCDGGATLGLIVERARAEVGVGLALEVRRTEVLVTQVEEESPASRAGLMRGDRIVAIQGKTVAEMGPGEARSLVNANTRMGIELVILEPDGGTRTVRLKDGPIYRSASVGSAAP